jgi:hypothetical protein
MTQFSMKSNREKKLSELGYMWSSHDRIAWHIKINDLK